MLKIYKRHLTYFKTYIRNISIYLVSHYYIRSSNNRNNKSIVIDIKSNYYRRHFANLIFWFIDQGYTVFLINRYKAIGGMKLFYDEVFKMPQFFICNKIPPNAEIIFTDRNENLAKKEIYLNPDYFRNFNLNHIPLGMLPYMYLKGYYKVINGKLKNKNNRHVKIFFSGRLTTAYYSHQIIKTKFDKLTRLEILEILKTKLKKDQLVIPQNFSDFDRTDLSNKVIFNDRNKFMIERTDFLSFLANCDFFLCTPGSFHPICHNNFEAMAVGTILILQHPEYFYPALQHNKNCIVFNDERDLIEKINTVLRMSQEEIDELRRNVNDYYEKYLTNEKIVSRIIETHLKGTNEFFFGLD